MLGPEGASGDDQPGGLESFTLANMLSGCLSPWQATKGNSPLEAKKSQAKEAVDNMFQGQANSMCQCL